ncbi:hypothetical protein B296_00037751 [Ensete ventricosum]|uniref:Uncharacterized protein n=1 Tax=Ensete ventricosum TaxID=4639 RepID=A0A426ZYL8_ENSVE|nr:hypothetical protein B296_00037751 [Ensete ventricosum]
MWLWLLENVPDQDWSMNKVSQPTFVKIAAMSYYTLNFKPRSAVSICTAGTSDFDRRWSISGGINRGREKEEENLESGAALPIRRPRDSLPASDFFSPREEKKHLP